MPSWPSAFTTRFPKRPSRSKIPPVPALQKPIGYERGILLAGSSIPPMVFKRGPKFFVSEQIVERGTADHALEDHLVFAHEIDRDRQGVLISLGPGGLTTGKQDVCFAALYLC